MSARLLFLRDALPVARYEHRPLRGELSSGEVKISHKFVTPSTSRFRNGQDRFPTEHFIIRAIPHNSKSRYGERGAAEAKPKAQIILDAAKVSTASGGNSEPKQEQRSQSARGFCPRSTMRVPQPDIIEHFGNADAVPQPSERCLSRKAGIVRCCLRNEKLEIGMNDKFICRAGSLIPPELRSD